MPYIVEYASFDRKYRGIAKFPAVTRDLSMVVPKEVLAGDIEKVFDEKIEAASIEHAELAEDEIEVGEDEFFVLGDNRNNSEDSRYANIGNVKKEYIMGKAWFIVSPLKDFGFVK